MDNLVETPTGPRTAAVVLSGGKSSRMGRPKAELSLGGRTLLDRIVDTVSQVVEYVVVVAAINQQIPTVSRRIATIRDQADFQGPLGAIGWGLVSLPASVEKAFVTSCDAPLLNAHLIEMLFARLETADIVVPRLHGRQQPLCAAYRPAVGRTALRLFEEGVRRPIALFEHHPYVEMTESDLRSVDPELRSFINANTPAEFAEMEALFHADVRTHRDR